LRMSPTELMFAYILERKEKESGRFYSYTTATK